jgi:hypothetical protein
VPGNSLGNFQRTFQPALEQPHTSGRDRIGRSAHTYPEQ